QDKLREKLPAEAATSNPVDLIASAGPDEFYHATSTLIESGEVDSVVVIHVEVTPGFALPVAEALRRCQDDHPGDVTMLTGFMGGEDAASLLAGEDGARTIPHYQSPEQAALALTRAVDYGDWQRRDPGTVPHLDAIDGAAARDIVDSAPERLGAAGGRPEP